VANIRIKWNPNLEKELTKAVAPAMRELAAERTQQYDELIAAHQDGDLETVKAELVRIYDVAGGSITDPELTQHAAAILAGQRIVFRS
jgi:hypothetical protein